jgi:hypothetical protein
MMLDPLTKARVDAVAGALRALPPGTPDTARIELLNILADVPAELRPALDGSLRGGV